MMRFQLALVQVTTIAAVAALGFVILVASAGGQEGGNTAAVAPTPTRTVEETSALSDRLHAEDKQAQDAVADDIITNHRSVKDIQHGDSTAMSIVPSPSLDAALQQASALVAGTVEDQFLSWGINPIEKVRALYLVSVLRTDDGSTAQIAQPVAIARTQSGVQFSGGSLLEADRSYAILVEPGPIGSAPSAIRGQIYDLFPDGSIRQGPNSAAASLAELSGKLQAVNPTAATPCDLPPISGPLIMRVRPGLAVSAGVS